MQINSTNKTFNEVLHQMQTDINDLFWFEEEFLCELLGIDFDEYLCTLKKPI